MTHHDEKEDFLEAVSSLCPLAFQFGNERKVMISFDTFVPLEWLYDQVGGEDFMPFMRDLPLAFVLERLIEHQPEVDTPDWLHDIPNEDVQQRLKERCSQLVSLDLKAAGYWGDHYEHYDPERAVA